MEVQGFAPVHLVAQVSFARSQGAVVDNRGKLGSMMAEQFDLENVSVKTTAAQVEGGDGRDQYRIGIAQLRVSLRSFTEFDDALERVRRFFKLALDQLDNPVVIGATAHTTDVAATDSLEGLRNILAERVTPPTGMLKEALGIPFADLGLSFRFEDPEKSSTHIQFGPMDEAELAEFLQDPTPTGYPSTGLMLDVQTRHIVVADPGEGEADVIGFWEKALASNRRTTERTGSWLKEAIS
jgi:hypothetical protein